MTDGLPTVSTPFLQLKNISKYYGEKAVVESLSLDIGQGEFISLLGPSGGGKTTTLHMIAGFLPVEQGDILLNGAAIQDIPPNKRDIAIVFQSYALFPHMSVFDNVAFGLKMQKMAKAAIAKRVHETLALVKLTEFTKTYPYNLSGGQQQRVALARAIAVRPKLLLLDEPLSNLDPALRQELRKVFSQIHQVTGMTTILVTHDIEEAFTTSDRVAILGQGKLQQYAAPAVLYQQPASVFVARFIGHKNIFRASILYQAAQPFLADVLPQVSSTKDPYLVVPVYALQLAAAPSPSAQVHNSISLAATLTDFEYLGAHVRYTLQAGVLELTGESLATEWQAHFRVGDPLTVSWPVDQMITIAQA